MPQDDNAALVALVRGAAAGGEDAWRVLYDRFTPLLRNVARGFRLGPADVDDVVQTTWSLAFSQISALNNPAPSLAGSWSSRVGSVSACCNESWWRS